MSDSVLPGRRGVAAVITARAGSKRLPGKNVRDFMGQPLVVWSVTAALAVPEIERIVVSTDDPAVVEALQGIPVEILNRPAHLATDQARSKDVIRHADGYLGGAKTGPNLMVLLQPTSPLRERGLIERALVAMRECSDAEQLVEVTSQTIAIGRIVDGWWKPEYREGVRSQELPSIWYPSGRLYVYRCQATFDIGRKAAGRTLPLPAPFERCTNIDEEADFLWAEVVYRRFAEDYHYLRY